MKLKAAGTIMAIILAVTAGIAGAEDMDVRALSAKLAAQEAMLADIEAKMASAQEEGNAADGITSLRKNATVTLGGLVSTGVFYGSGSVKLRDNQTVNNPNGDGRLKKAESYKGTDLKIADAELYAQVDVNDNFDAYLYLSLHDAADKDDAWGVAKAYYVRWKNIANTGFGIKVGRDRAAFGSSSAGEGYFDNLTAGGGGDGLNWWFDFGDYVPVYNGWKYNGLTQVTPYWEGMDGKLRFEVSLFQNLWNDTGSVMNSTKDDARYNAERNDRNYYRSRNYGLGSASFRATYTPVEDLTFTASIINFRSNRFSNGTFFSDWEENEATGELERTEYSYKHAKNNTAVALAYDYRPCWFNKMRLYGQWVHGWNVNNWRNVDSDVVTTGVTFDLTENMSVFAQGDYLKTRYRNSDVAKGTGTGWATYAGIIYTLPVGAVLEAGYRHDQYKYKEAGQTQMKAKGDMVYGMVAFEF